MARYASNPIAPPSDGSKFTGAALATQFNELAEAITSGHYHEDRPEGAAKGCLWSKRSGDEIQIMLYDGNADIMVAQWTSANGLQLVAAANAAKLTSGKIPTDRLNTRSVSVTASGQMFGLGTSWNDSPNAELWVPETGKFFVGYMARLFALTGSESNLNWWSSRIVEAGVQMREIMGVNMRNTGTNHDSSATGAFVADMTAGHKLKVQTYVNVGSGTVDVDTFSSIDIFRIG